MPGATTTPQRWRCPATRLQVSPPAATRKACPSQTVIELEQEYLERIANASAFTVTDDRLQLSLSDGSGMAFRPEKR